MDLWSTEGGPNFGVRPQHLVEHPGLGSEEKVVASLKGNSDWKADLEPNGVVAGCNLAALLKMTADKTEEERAF